LLRDELGKLLKARLHGHWVMWYTSLLLNSDCESWIRHYFLVVISNKLLYLLARSIGFL
jgi:hypothetical protein